MTDAGAEAMRPAVSRSKRPRSNAALAVFGLVSFLVVAGLIALGSWQVQRRAWKHDLIAQVEGRIHAAPVAPPAPADWVKVDAARDAYRRVRVTGRFLHDRETLVRATTVHGSGYWVLTPLQTAQGYTLLVNRGFVPPARRDPATRTAGQVAGTATVTGLMRISEPEGGFLRSNDPAAGNWYSRDVAAIGKAHGLSQLAPYFIDADASPNPGGYPIGGLTVIRFPDNHLSYALTWFALALLSIGAAAFVIRDELRRRAAEPAA